MLKAIKIRLYPTETQQNTINKLLGCCRLVYNRCLDHRNKIYEETKESGSLSKSYKYFCELKEMEEYSFLKTDAHSKVIQQTLMIKMLRLRISLLKSLNFQNSSQRRITTKVVVSLKTQFLESKAIE